MPSVLFLSGNGQIGGVARPLVNITRVFAERGHNVTLAFPQTEHTESLNSWCAAQGVQPRVAPAGFEENTVSSRQDLQELMRFVRSTDASVVSLHYGCNYLSLKDILAIRLTGRSCFASLYSPHPASIMDEQQLRTTRFAARLCRKITFLSKWSRADYVRLGLRGNQLLVIPPALRAPSRIPTQAQARAALGIPQDAFVITTHGRLVEDKGIRDAIRALEILRKTAEENGDSIPWLLVAGQGVLRDEFEKLAREIAPDGTIRILGQVNDPTDFYAAGDVFVLPSQAESFGIVYVEAAFFGVPSVGTDVNAVPETVLDVKTGLIIPPKDPRAVADAITKLRKDPELRHRLGDAARSRALAEFTDEAIATRFEKLLL